ncbi:MAG: PLP-dependent aspartate aminotransferase family protein [Flavobacteriales bacterium]|jgi:cystathionine gamma-lyase|nr:PLP-dependent aspartate aminotransferase family protein [Flavobacteriales bacterium]
MKFRTTAIHTGEKPNTLPGGSGDAVSPIHLATTFAREKVEIPTNGYEYSRSLNPTRKTLEDKLAAIENAQYGLAFASGLASESTLLFALVKSGDHVVCMDDVYGGTQRLFRKVFAEKYQVSFDFVDMTVAENVKNVIQENTKLIWLETPTNPMLKISDIEAIAKIAKEHGVILAVDNTFMSPYFQSPLELGADVVMHSTSKYINGHSDSIGGALMMNDSKLYEQVQFMQNSVGAIMAPFDSYMVARGIKTLGMRMEQHQKNAMAIAEFLENHPKVKKCIYPGLPSHPQYALAKKQMKGFGGMISVDLDTDLEGTNKFLEKLHHFVLAESLGGVESLVEHPAIMTHASVPAEDRAKLGISDSLVRISVGVENLEDLLEDLENSLKVI